MEKKFWKKSYFVLTAVIILALILVFYKNLSYKYEMQGDVTEVFYEYYGGAAGYNVSETDGGKYFRMTGSDPQFYLMSSLGNIGGTIGGIELIIKGDSEAAEIPVQVFYAEQGESFSEKKSVNTKFLQGEDRLRVPIPMGEYSMLRFDIDGNFTISQINVCNSRMLVKPYVSEGTVQKCLWYFPAVIIGFLLIFWAHGVHFREGAFTLKSYAENLFFGAKPSKDREVHLDYMRILAAVLVILAHACSPMVALIEETGGADWKRLVLVCGLSLGLSCNLLYVMLSGALLLNNPKNDENVVDFYLKRASKVIIPLIAYYMLLLSFNKEVGFLPPRNIGAAFKRIMTGAPDVGPHLWLIYTIVSLYIVTPFFRIMVKNLSDKMILSLAVVIIAVNFLTNYLPVFGMVFGFTTFLAGWEGVFLLGYIMTRQNEMKGADKRNNIIMAAAVAAFIISASVVFDNSTRMNYVYNNAPTMVILSCGIFALFLKYREKFFGKSNLFVRLCSKYSYSIILIHWYSLFVVVQGRLHITALRFGCIGGIAATVVLTFIVCLAIAFVFDNTVVIVCNALFDKLIYGIKGLRNK